MQARIRDVELADCNECINLMRDHRPFFGGYLQNGGLLELVAGIWERLLKHPAISSGLAEDLQYPPGQRIFNFGFMGFVRENWYREYLTNPVFYCGEAPLREIASDTQRILMTAGEVAEANSGQGLISVNLFNAHWSERIFSNVDATQVGVGAYLHAAKGFRIKAVLMDAAGRQERSLALDSGILKVRSFYESDFPDMPKNPDRGDIPVLVGADRDEVSEISHSLTFTAQLFRHHRIRYGFSQSQQEFLRLALKYPTDDELLRELNERARRQGNPEITIDALGGRWDRIFKRVELLQPVESPVIPRGTKSSGKRSRVLMHFSREFHELRPHNVVIPLPREKGRLLP